MKPEHINQARDAIAARAVQGDGYDRDGDPSDSAVKAKQDYINISLNPYCGWGAALDEIERLKRESEAARKHRDAERDEHDRLVRSLRSQLERERTDRYHRLSLPMDAS